MTSRRPAILVSVVGVVAVALYAAMAAVQILVLNPLAAVPGRTLLEIRAGMSDAGERIDVGMVLGILAVGVVIALVVAGLMIAARTPAVATAMPFLVVLVLGAPAYFFASFGPGMGLADAYGISGADYSPWAWPLYGVSVAAFVTFVVLAVMSARTAPRTGVALLPAQG
ncbi:MAG: hypothetical protein J7484_12370 [Microbacterium sp.]|nr:hypothetical protein [Microbacterium sp.]